MHRSLQFGLEPWKGFACLVVYRPPLPPEAVHHLRRPAAREMPPFGGEPATLALRPKPQVSGRSSDCYHLEATREATFDAGSLCFAFDGQAPSRQVVRSCLWSGGHSLAGGLTNQ